MAFGDPQRGSRDGYGKVVDFDSVKLGDGNLNRGEIRAEGNLAAQENAQDFVFQPPQGKIGFREEVAAPGGGIEKDEARELLLKFAQAAFPRPHGGNAFDCGKFRFQLVKEKRVDDFVDVFDRGVMHAARAARFGVEGAFKHRAENRRTDFRPVEVFARLDEEEFANFVGEARDLDFLVGEKSAVDVRERGEVFGQVFVALFRRGIENAE